MKTSEHKRQSGGRTSGFEQLFGVCQALAFEPHDIAARISRQGLYHEDMEREFSLLIKLFHYTSRRHTPSVTWHERMELFTPLDGPVRMRYGGTEVRLEPGDTLIVESLKPHGILDFAGFDTRVVVITFMPDFVFSLGSPSDDFALLLPFYTWGESHPKVLLRSETMTESVHDAIARLLHCYFDRGAPMPLRRIGCKALLCGLLFHTGQRFGSSAVLQTEILRQQERSQRLKPLFEHISNHYGEPLSLGSAARLAKMSRPTFMRTFKRVAGMTLVDYMHHVRLSHGLRLLKETELSIAEVADKIGYTDQGYFDRKFKEAFLQSPRQFREAVARPGVVAQFRPLPPPPPSPEGLEQRGGRLGGERGPYSSGMTVNHENIIGERHPQSHFPTFPVSQPSFALSPLHPPHPKSQIVRGEVWRGERATKLSGRQVGRWESEQVGLAAGLTAGVRGFAYLLEVCKGLRFDPHAIAHMLDKTGNYQEPWSRGLPFTIRLFHYTSRRFTPGLTWHERLELFLPVDGSVRFQMGDDVLILHGGDLLVVDNLKLHRVLDFKGFNSRVIVISFLPEFVYNLGSPAHDYGFLLPFYAKLENRPHLIRASEDGNDRLYRTVAELVRCFFEQPTFYRVGCRAFLLQLLHELAMRFQSSETLRSVFLRQQENERQLTKLLEHIRQNYAERLLLKEATRMVGMSRPKMTKQFKNVTGMTLVDYVCQVRLNNAARLLREGELSVGEIAVSVGFSDQSHFDRRFREFFGQTPLAYRKSASTLRSTATEDGAQNGE